MPQYSQENKPIKLNMDIDHNHLPADSMFYALNHEIHQNGPEGTLGKATPMPANKIACDLQVPAGENYTISPTAYYSPLTNESYDFVYNSNGVHFIKRINGDGDCEIVYHGCLYFSADPKHAITPSRVHLRVEKLCANRHGKALIFTDGTEAGIYWIDVEASIATNFFTTSFFDRCANDCAYVKMCVPEICGCVNAEFVPLPASDIGKSNYITDKPFQFMIKHVYYDGRESEWSERSTVYYQGSKGCFNNSADLPRCMKLRIPIGNPMVDRIRIAFTDNGGLNWYITEEVEKYKKYNSSQEKWYERGLAELTNYSDADCSFDYFFCNDKERQPIDPSELTRVTNPIPREAQGLITIKDALGFYNYKEGTCPTDKIQVDKMRIEAVCDTAVSQCQTEFSEVTVRAIIHEAHELNGFIFRTGGDTRTDPDDPDDPAYFGGVSAGVGSDYPLQVSEGQMFQGKTRNFIAYIEGTDYWGEMKQWKSAAKFVSRREWGVISKMSDIGTRRDLFREQTEGSSGVFFYQEIKLKVPKGTKGFLRLASHKMQTGAGAAQDTSTFVVGILDDIREYEGQSAIDIIGFDKTTKELYFDTCNGDVEFFKAFIIADNTRGATTDFIPSYSGYIKDKNGFPVEGVVLDVPSQAGNVVPVVTDHNGFYHFNVNDASVSGELLGELDCNDWEPLHTVDFQGFAGVHTERDIVIDNTTYAENFYSRVEVTVRDCDGNPVPGVRVAISGGKFRTTNGLGLASFRIRNYQQRNRVVRVVVMNAAGCITMDCGNDCNPCLPEESRVMPGCFSGVPVVNAGTFTINTEYFLDKRGLKAGGRYPFGIVIKGDCGRHSPVYHLKYIEIPKTQEKNGLSFCSFRYNGTGAEYPDWATCLQIVRGKNENGFLLQWVVDSIERSAAGKITITIQSLNDYNQRFAFKGNTIYQWKKGDRVEFIRNGDGKIFSTTTRGVLNYLTLSPFHDEIISGLDSTDADYFNQLIIEDDGRLSDLKAGAIIELQRPREEITETIYYEICASLEIKNRELVHKTGTFDTFDTFIVNRTSGAFLGFFEHHSPSDFWGDHVSDIGRGYVVNKFENERRYGRNISISSVGVPNRFGDLVKTFGAPEHGDITAMFIKDAKIIIAIGEHDSFLAQSADDLLRVGGDGIIRAASPDQIISDAEPKIRGTFGCQYPDIGSIFNGDGYVTWADVNNRAYVKHDYREAVDISEGKAQSFFRRKFQEMLKVNKSTSDFLMHYRFSTGINQVTKAVYLTIKSLRHASVNNEIDPFVLPNTTLAFHPSSNEFSTFCSFTPDGYGYVNLTDDEGCRFLTYQNAVPYIHPIIASKWNEFYGIACDWMLGLSINQFPNKTKVPMAIEYKGEQMWYIKAVRTSKPSFLSEIPPIRFKRSNGKWNAAFLNDLNSRGGLYNGFQARDMYITSILCRDNTDGLKVNTTDDNKRTQYGELDSILFKFSVSEQSGFDQNV